MGTVLSVRRSADSTLEWVDENNPLPVEVEGQLGIFLSTGVMFTPDLLPATPKFAVISTASSGGNTLVAAVTNKKIRVLSAILMSAGTTTVTFQTAAGGTSLVGAIALTTQTGFTLPFNPVGWFETLASQLLNLNNSAAIQVSGCLTYIEVA